MWWLVLPLVWWSGTSAIPSPGPQPPPEEWKCPEITEQPIVECSCDMPHTLRCTGDKSAMQIIARTLRSLTSASVSLLDCTVQNVSIISEPLLEGISLHGLVISSGEIKDINSLAFQGLASPLQALGLPNNLLVSVPSQALKYLPELDRLDLSGNRLKKLDGGSFKGLRNLSFVDISNNVLSEISPNAFDNLPVLKILRLKGNRLSLPVIKELKPLPTVEEMDLSGNLLKDPIGPITFPQMDSLRDLQLSHNSLSSIKKGALQGLLNLTSLRLQHNMIDVIEDHAFSHLSSLILLDLAHNRIVAVSGASLAHLNRLTDLDLRHNFLRALTPDLIQPLKSLKNLKLDENDISIIASDALKPTTMFKHFSLSENPLNCDCSLIEFTSWLMNTTLSKEDKATAICATPPSLENGLLVEVPLENLICGEDEPDTVMAPLSSPYRVKITLQDFIYDGGEVKLTWNVEDNAAPYTCDAIFVYEEVGPNEVLLESNPIKCNSSEMKDPTQLQVTVPPTLQLQSNHKYRYCVVLFESGKSDDVSIIPGCSDMISLVRNSKFQRDSSYSLPNILSIEANLSNLGSLSVDVTLYPEIINCDLNVALLEQTTVLYQRKVSCSDPKCIFVGLDRGPYRVCANILQRGPVIDFTKPRCVNVLKREVRKFSNLDIAFVSVFLILCLLIVGLIWGVRKILLRPKIQTHQSYLPPECDDQVQHNRYVKLQATTKL